MVRRFSPARQTTEYMSQNTIDGKDTDFFLYARIFFVIIF